MNKISELDLGSALLSIFILAGFIATAFVIIRLTIIGINIIYEKYFKEEVDIKQKNQTKKNTKGF